MILADLRRGVVAQATTDADGLFALPLAAVSGGAALPEGFVLGANYPNPFNPATVIPYQLAATAQVRLEVFFIKCAGAADGGAGWMGSKRRGRIRRSGMRRMRRGGRRQRGCICIG